MKLKRLVFALALLCSVSFTTALALDQRAGSCQTSTLSTDRKIPTQIEKHLQDWWTISNVDRALQVALGMVGMASALVVSTFTDQLGPRNTKIFSFVAALSFGILNGFDIGGKADSARRGWRHLTAAVLRFETDPCFTYAELIEAYAQGEDMVGNVAFRGPGGGAAPPAP